jgi:hypothetical protein
MYDRFVAQCQQVQCMFILCAYNMQSFVDVYAPATALYQYHTAATVSVVTLAVHRASS